MPTVLSKYEDMVMQEYQAGYHTGYKHGIGDASTITWEDIKRISDIEYQELNEVENEGKTLEEVYKKIAERFNQERKEALIKKAKNGGK